MRRVVVTGIGIVSSIGNNTNEVYESLLQGKSGITKNEDMRDNMIFAKCLFCLGGSYFSFDLAYIFFQPLGPI